MRHIQAAIARCGALLAGYRWSRDTFGQSGAAVYRLHGKPKAPDLYLKYGKDAIADDIGHEAARLNWLRQHVPVPAVVHYVRTPDEAWLVTTAMPGENAWQILEARPEKAPAVADALASFLRRLHAIPLSACPFTNDHACRLAQARARIDAGLVDDDDFDEVRLGWSTEQVWDAMLKLLPLQADPVVTHGDFSLGNLFLVDGEVVGCIDTGRAGIADRYQDIAIVCNCLGVLSPTLQQRFLRQYGISHADHNKLAFHLMLDEFF